jgi:hypothetical protein
LQESPDEDVSDGQTVTSEVGSHLQVSVQVLHARQELLFGMVGIQLGKNELQPLINLNLRSASCPEFIVSMIILYIPQRLPMRCFHKDRGQGKHERCI